jgi:hypothetical protein
MKTPTRKERAALARVEVIAGAEQTRWALWEAISLVDRQRALSLSGMDKARAVQPLASFTDQERMHIACAIGNHVSRMEVLAKIMVMAQTNLHGYLH